jgi:DNA invertase Pin-like site-specific DNA recombinase
VEQGSAGVAPFFRCRDVPGLCLAEQADEQNLDAQEKHCREYAKQKSLDVLQVFVDGGKTGRNVNREAFKSLLTFCRQNKHKLRAVVCYDVSRWACSVAGWATTIDTLDDLCLEFHSVLERVDQTASGPVRRQHPRNRSTLF